MRKFPPTHAHPLNRQSRHEDSPADFLLDAERIKALPNYEFCVASDIELAPRSSWNKGLEKGS